MLLNNSMLSQSIVYSEMALGSYSGSMSGRMLMFMSGPVLDLTDPSVSSAYLEDLKIKGDIFSRLDPACSFVAYHPLSFDEGIKQLTQVGTESITIHFTSSKDQIKVLDFDSEITWAMYITYRPMPSDLVPSVPTLMPLSIYGLSTLTVGPTPDFDIQLSSSKPTSGIMQILSDLTVTF